MAPKGGKGGGSSSFRSGSSSSSSFSSSQCASAGAFKNPYAVANLALSAVFLFLLLLVWYYGSKRWKALKALNKPKTKGWVAYNFAIFLVILSFIADIVTLCLAECNTLNLVSEIQNANIPSFWLFYTGLLTLYGVIAFPLIANLCAMQGTKRSFIMKVIIAIFFTIICVVVIARICIITVYYSAYNQLFESGDGVSVYDLARIQLRLGAASMALLTAFAGLVAFSIIFKIFRRSATPNQSSFRSWSIFLIISIFCFSLDSFVQFVYSLGRPTLATQKVSTVLTGLLYLFLVTSFTCTMVVLTNLRRNLV